MKTYGIWTGCH